MVRPIFMSDLLAGEPVGEVYWKGQPFDAEAFIRRGGDLHDVDDEGNTILNAVCECGDFDRDARLLIKNGSRVDHANKDGDTSLHMASLKGHARVVRILVKKNADPNVENYLGATPLHNACWRGHVDVADVLIRNGALDQGDNDGNPPLYCACSRGHIDLARYLLEDCAARRDVKNNYGNTPLHIASWQGHPEVARLLIKNDAKLNSVNEYGETPIFMACWDGHVDVVSLLIDKGADVDHACRDGNTPLHKACSEDHIDVVRILVENDVELDQVNQYNGETPLHMACERGRSDVVSLLIENGAAWGWGKAPFALASQCSRNEIVDLLENSVDMSMAKATYARDGIKQLLHKAKPTQPCTKRQGTRHPGRDDDLAAIKVRHKAVLAATKTRYETELTTTKTGLTAEITALEAELAALKAIESDHKATVTALEGELKRWRDGDMVCKQIIDVETGAVTTTAVQAQEAVETATEPRTKRPRHEESLLSRLVQVKTEAVQETARLQEELETTTLCVLCQETPRDMYFSGCGHCLSCGACADRLLAQHGGTRKRTNAPCPVCRQPIKRILPFRLV